MGTFSLTLKETLAYTYPESVNSADARLRTEAFESLGLNDYPIFDEDYRPTLNSKIVNHFWNREIAHETISLFVFATKRLLNEIMPKYNALYTAQARQTNPLVTFNTHQEQENSGEAVASNTGERTSEQNSDVSGKARAVNSEHPQEHLSDTGDYATAASDSNSLTTTVGVATDKDSSATRSDTSGKVVADASGFSGVSFASLMAEMSDLFVNVDMEIIGEMDKLFMLVWDNGDQYSDRPVWFGGVYW